MARFKVILSFLVAMSSLGTSLTYAQPTAEQFKAFRCAKTIRVIVEEFYAESRYGKTIEFELPFEIEARKFLDCVGLKVVKADAKTYDVTLKIKAKGQALGAWYSDGRYHYTGGIVEGNIALEVPGIPAYVKFFKGGGRGMRGKIPADDLTSEEPHISSDVLFSVDFDEHDFDEDEQSFVETMLTMMKDVYFDYLLSQVSIDIKEQILELFERDTRRQEEVIRQLGEMEARAYPAIPYLIAILKNQYYNDTIIREALGKIALNWRENEATNMAILDLVGRLKDEDTLERDFAAESLGRINDRRVVGPLISALKDENIQVRCDAVEALGNIGDFHAVEPLVDVIKDKNEDSMCRVAAAKALGKIKDFRAVKPLIDVLKDKDWWIAQEVGFSLKEITGQDFGDDAAKWQQWWDENKEKFGKGK